MPGILQISSLNSGLFLSNVAADAGSGLSLSNVVADADAGAGVTLIPFLAAKAGFSRHRGRPGKYICFVARVNNNKNINIHTYF
jgi:hypothetical protein